MAEVELEDGQIAWVSTYSIILISLPVIVTQYKFNWNIEDDLEKIGDEIESKRDLWDDDIGGSNAEQYDLAELSKAALQFRSDMNDMKILGEGGIEDGGMQEDAMEGLMRDQESNKLSIADDPVFTLPSESKPLQNSNSIGDKLSTLLSSVDNISKLGGISDPFAPSLQNFPNDDFFPSLGVPINNFYGANSVSYQEELQWLYTDPQQQVQGPFSQDNMQRWNEEGYFSFDLPIKLSSWSRFYPFNEIFPDTKFAFITVPIEPMQPKVFDSAHMPSVEKSPIPDNFPSINVEVSNEKQHQHSELDLKISNEAKKVTKCDAEKSSAESQKVSHDVSKSDFAKKLLGIGGNSSVDIVKVLNTNSQPSLKDENKSVQVENAEQNSQKQVSKVSTKVSLVTLRFVFLLLLTLSVFVQSWAVPQETVTNVKPAISLADIQHQQLLEEERKIREEKQREENAPAPTISPSPAPPSSAMSFQLKSLLGVKGGDANPSSKPKAAWSAVQPQVEAPNSSLKDIMKEEISQKRNKEDSQTVVKIPGSSWAAKAMVGTTVVPSTANSSSDVKKIVVSEKASASDDTKPQNSASVRNIEIKKGNDKSDFGGKVMNKEMADWCSGQLKKINGTEDLTLMQFCMSLKSAVEIREYLAEYLGSSPQVTNFATEFIRFKEDGKRPLSSSVEKPVDSAIKSSTISQLARKKKPSNK